MACFQKKTPKIELYPLRVNLRNDTFTYVTAMWFSHPPVKDCEFLVRHAAARRA